MSAAVNVKAMVCEAWGGPETLVLKDLALPALGPKEVRIKVHAAGLNFPDTLMIAGKYQFKPAFPFAPGMECGGEIAEVGEKVGDLKVGDRVMATTGSGNRSRWARCSGCEPAVSWAGTTGISAGSPVAATCPGVVPSPTRTGRAARLRYTDSRATGSGW